MPSGQLVSAAWEGESRARAMMAGGKLVGLEERKGGGGERTAAFVVDCEAVVCSCALYVLIVS